MVEAGVKFARTGMRMEDGGWEIGTVKAREEEIELERVCEW